MAETQCPVPADKCKERTCVSGACGSKDKDCGMLTCSFTTGMCEGCNNNNPMKKCPNKECNDVACVNKTCKDTPNGALPCGAGTGTCDDAGNCGLCTDGCQRGRSGDRLRSVHVWCVQRGDVRGWHGLPQWILCQWGVLRRGL